MIENEEQFNDETEERKFLNRHPLIKQKVLNDERFHKWFNKLPRVKIDNEDLYIRGGDLLKDMDQIIYEWAYNNGLIEGQSPKSSFFK